MKLKLVLLGMLSVAGCITGVAQTAFGKGDRKVDLTVGVGVVDYMDKGRISFDQHLGMEWGVASFSDKLSLGLGVNVNNTYGGSFETVVLGSYDYSYHYTCHGQIYSYPKKKWESFNDSKDIHRKGTGTADADVAREDVNAQAVAALHFSPSSRLDTYLKVGAGVGYMNWIISNIHNEEGFHTADKYIVSDTKITKSTTIFSYNDLDHVKWEGAKSKIVPAMSVYLGATYMLTDKWGVDAQLGLISANLKGKKKGYPNSYSVFALGASYRF